MELGNKEKLSAHVEKIFKSYVTPGLHICDIATGGGKSYTIGKLTCEFYPLHFDRIIILCVQNKLVNGMDREIERFISTPDEEAFLATDEAVERYARGIYNAFVQYKNKYDLVGRRAPMIEILPVKQPAVKEEPKTQPKAEEIKAKESQDDKQQQQQTVKPQTSEPVFKVQIVATSKPLSKNSDVLKGLDDVDSYYQRNIDDANRGQTTIITYANSKLHKLRLLVAPPRCVTHALRRLCRTKHIDTVHFLSGDALYLPLIKECTRQYKTFLTVHDAAAHDAAKSWYKMLRQEILYRKFYRAIDVTPHLITNSRTQQDYLSARYPSKSVRFHSFPTLVTPRISTGILQPPELGYAGRQPVLRGAGGRGRLHRARRLLRQPLRHTEKAGGGYAGAGL